MSWQGPIRIGELGTDLVRPPESQGVYVISETKWVKEPTNKDHVIYVGKAGTLRWRLGEIVAVLLGFGPSGELRYLHGRARRIFHSNCHSDIAESAKLFLGWLEITSRECIDCEEAKLFDKFYPTGELNFAKKPKCSQHRLGK
ncbi:MAG: hypothetical protein ABSD31_10170 [Candidatus Binataceae bacterium]|jgi:hypothetical protein